MHVLMYVQIHFHVDQTCKFGKEGKLGDLIEGRQEDR